MKLDSSRPTLVSLNDALANQRPMQRNEDHDEAIHRLPALDHLRLCSANMPST